MEKIYKVGLATIKFNWKKLEDGSDPKRKHLKALEAEAKEIINRRIQEGLTKGHMYTYFGSKNDLIEYTGQWAIE